MCFDEWNMNTKLTKVLKLVSVLFTNLKISPTREGAVRDVNRGAMNRMQCQLLRLLHQLDKLLGWRHVLEKNFSLHVKMCSVFRILGADGSKCLLHSAGKVVGPDHFANRPHLLLFCCIQQQYTWSTLPEKMQEKNFFETYKLTTDVCSTFDRGKVFFLHKKIVKNNYSKTLFYCSET